ncbi:dipeptide/oligopeptide/nickel ABC transporter permease/ATP-binding protein [Kineococcus arenarius]|uniref:dipeptide/oligopeptide/nickel ABC transporter permease/ATP-binding protein n=1 Tax=unclassified Kineococcus TaxID=2621656 RepID=UPI003D7D214B
MSAAVPVGGPAATAPVAEQASGAAQTWRRLRRQPATLAALLVLLCVVVAAAAAPLLAPYGPADTDFTAPLSGPTAEHPLGTDELGRDTLSRLLFAARTALVVAGGSVLVAMLIGVPLGLLLGYKGGWYDRLGSRGLDVADALPGLMVGFVVIAVLGRGVLVLILAIGIILCMNFARLTRAITLAERRKPYVESARVSGLNHRQVVFGQVLPNLAGPLAVQGAVFLGASIKLESALSFLGLGLSEEQPSWGGMLSVAAANQADHPWMALPPGIAIVLTVLALNVLGDGFNDALSGRQRTRRRWWQVLRSRPASPVTPPASPAPGAVAAGDRASADPHEAGAVVVGDGPDRGADGSARPVLEVSGLTVVADRPAGGAVRLVEDVSFTLQRGEVLGLLGESGSGKSMLGKAVLGLLPRGVRLAGGSVLLNGVEVANRSEHEMRAVRGSSLGVVFQNPQANLSPVHTIGRQLAEPLRAHRGMSRGAARERAAELLDLVGVDDPRRRLDQYPYQFSGGMAQRVAIALALAGEPEVLIADEATSALDVTTQSQVMDLLLDLREKLDMSIIMVTHDLGVAAETCDRVAVMYAGQLVEVADVGTLFHHPRHPYTAALLAAHPAVDRDVDRLPTIPGRVPLAGDWPRGCHFAGRCAFARDECTAAPVLMTDRVRCVRARELALEVSHA